MNLEFTALHSCTAGNSIDTDLLRNIPNVQECDATGDAMIDYCLVYKKLSLFHRSLHCEAIVC